MSALFWAQVLPASLLSVWLRETDTRVSMLREHKKTLGTFGSGNLESYLFVIRKIADALEVQGSRFEQRCAGRRKRVN